MNLKDASKYHRLIIQTLLVTLAFVISSYFFPEDSLLSLLGLVIVAFNMFCCFKLASSINKNGILWATLAFFGFLLLWMPQFLLINSANKAFRAAGKKVNFMGGVAEYA